jgi:hypothetical protein
MGVLLYEMLSGVTPFDTRDRFVLLRQILTEAPTPLCVRTPQVSPALSEVVMAALRKVAGERFANADALRDALLPFLAPQHARLAELSENRGAMPQRPPVGVGVEHRSGVVRTGGAADATSAGVGVLTGGTDVHLVLVDLVTDPDQDELQLVARSGRNLLAETRGVGLDRFYIVNPTVRHEYIHPVLCVSESLHEVLHRRNKVGCLPEADLPRRPIEPRGAALLRREVADHLEFRT